MSSHGSATLEVDVPAIEKPQNGVAGLKHWRYDLMAGLQVAMMGIPLSLGIAVASGADHGKVTLQLTKAGLLPYFGGRTFSGMEQVRNKPYPDVYLVAAKSLGVPIERCAVIEDSPNGASAGVASGATVWGYVPQGEYHAAGAALQAVGVQRFFKDMAQLPSLLGLG